MLKKSKTLIALTLAAGAFTLLTSIDSQACSRYRSTQYQYNRVNTPIEARYDFNRNGYIGWQERYAMNHRRVNTWRERRCDYNHNGVVDPHEVGCVY